LPQSIARKWLILGLIAAIIIGGVFFVYNYQQKKAPENDVPAKMGVININKAIEFHPKYALFIGLKKEETALLRDFEKTRAELLAQEQERIFTARKSEQEAFGQEFDAKMKTKQEELERKVAAKSQTVGAPLNAEMDAYLKQINEEYQPQMADLQLKLRVLQMEEPEAKELIAKIEALKNEENAKIEAKQAELSQKMQELLAPDLKAVDEELNRYAAALSEELNAKMAAAKPQTRENIPMPPELKALEDKVVAKKQEIAALQAAMDQDLRAKITDLAIKNSLDTVAADFIQNSGAVDITDLVIAEFKK
jgi:hypothetical protein